MNRAGGNVAFPAHQILAVLLHDYIKRVLDITTSDSVRSGVALDM